MNKQGRVKKVPLRKCLATNQQFPKKEMIRVVRTPEGNVIVDEKGKANGRGAYISRNLEAVDVAQKKKLFDRQLEVEVPKEIYDQLRQIIGECN